MNEQNVSAILATLFDLLDTNQWAVVPVRRELAKITEETVDDFHLEAMDSGRYEELIGKMAQLGIIPPLPEGVDSPLKLNEAGTEYADPDAANQFLSLAFGAKVSETPIVDVVTASVVDTAENLADVVHQQEKQEPDYNG